MKSLKSAYIISAILLFVLISVNVVFACAGTPEDTFEKAKQAAMKGDTNSFKKCFRDDYLWKQEQVQRELGLFKFFSSGSTWELGQVISHGKDFYAHKTVFGGSDDLTQPVLMFSFDRSRGGWIIYKRYGVVEKNPGQD